MQAQALLKQHRIRRTAARTAVAELFIGASTALSQPELEHRLGTDFDRVTLYRTLNTFVEHGVLHRVPDDEGASRYALCRSDCEEKHPHTHDHAHFKCDRCGCVRCIEGVQLPEVVLPNGYLLEEARLMLKGRCPDCA